MDREENLEQTKELFDLNELKAQDEMISGEILEDMDQNLEESTEAFETYVEELETLELEDESEKEKEEEEEKNSKNEKKSFKEKLHNWKEKWMKIPKKKRIIILVVSFLILLLVIGGIVYFILSNKKDQEPEVKDVIVDLDNYRYKNGVLTFLDEDKNEIGEYTCKNSDQELCYVAYYSLEDQFDEPILVYEDETDIKKRSSIFEDRYVFVYDNKNPEETLITFYDIKEQKDVDQFLLIKGYDNLKDAVVLKNKTGQYGMMSFDDEQYQEKIAFSYDYLGIMENKENVSNAIVKTNGKWHLIDMNGEILTKPISSAIKDYNSKGIKIQDDAGTYHWVDYENNEKGAATYIDLLEEHVLQVIDGKLFVNDYENHKMNIEGIPLENTNYLTKYTYSSKNKLVKTEKSYEVRYQGNDMIIEVFQENGTDSTKKSLNLNEGRVSATLSYLDYFDGKLYFYKDSEKKNLLGSYPCENKNNFGEDSMNLTTCKIASESYYQDNDVEASMSGDMGLLPIYNERYVFVFDSSSDANIVLYDFKENAVKAKYKSVDAGSYSKKNEVHFASVNNQYMIAENKSGKYGIIKMNANGVEGVKGFDYHHIERIGLSYLVQDSSGYALMGVDGNTFTSSVTNKIRNYSTDAKHFVTKDSKYHLYDFDGKAKTPSGFDYIAMYEDYFATVSNQVLQFYSYDKPEVALIEGIKLYQNNYLGDQPSFQVTIRGTNATVKVLKSDKSYETITVSLMKNGNSDNDIDNEGD